MSEAVTKGKSGKALKAGLWYTISSITVKAIFVITTPFFSRMMTTEEYGIASNFNSWHNLLMIFCSLNLTYSIGRAKLDFQGKLDEYVGSMQLLSLFATTGLCLIALPFTGWLAEAMELNIPMMYILMIYLVFNPIISFTQSRYRYQYEYWGNIRIAAYSTLMSVGLTFLFMVFFKTDRYYPKILGSAVPACLLGIVYWVLAIKRKKASINLTYWKYGLRISLPLIFHSVSLYVLAQSDRLMITKFCGASDNGIYTLAYGFAVLINVILGSVNEAWLPWFHDSYFEGETDEIRKNVKPLIVLGCMMGIGCIAIAPEAMMILGPEEYRMGQWAVAPVALGLICQFLYQQYVHIELHLKKTQYISLGTVFAAALNIALNAIFIPKYGFIAAAYTTMFCYFILMFVHLFITRVILKVHIYDDWFIFTALFVVAGAAAGFMLLYDHVVIRYIILVILCGVYLLTNRSFIQKLIKSMKNKKGGQNEENMENV